MPQIKFDNNTVSKDINSIAPSSVKKQRKLSFSQKKLILIAIAFFLVLLIIFITIFMLFATSESNNSGDGDISPSVTPTPTPKPVLVSSPINGETLTTEEFEQKRNIPSLAVMIQNLTDSRPQHGLNEADVVYEALAESGITRFMTVYWSTPPPERIMSIRSARKYYVDLLGDYNNPVYAHIGYAESENPDTNAIGAIYNYGVRTLAFTSAFTWDDSCQFYRNRENCAYSTYSTLMDTARELYPDAFQSDIADLASWKFKYPDSIYQNFDLKDARSQSVVTTDTLLNPDKKLVDFSVNTNPFNSLDYLSNWKYDASKNNYLRYNSDGTPFISCNESSENPSLCTGEQVNSDVVIVQKVPQYPTFDEKGHYVHEVIGEGDANVMQNGMVYTVRWSKPDYGTRTRFYLPTGEEFVFNSGKIWIIITGTEFEYFDNNPVIDPTLTPTISNT